MPYMVVKEGDQFAVYKQDADKKPMGKALGMHPSRVKANEQLSALYASEPGIGKKDMPMMMKLEPDDPRVQYQPLGGNGTQACANCVWFMPSEACCPLIWDDVVATGKCNLWLGEPTKDEQQMQNPIPVVIVDAPAMDTGSAEFAVDANDNHPDKLPINDKGQIEGAITSVVTGAYRGNPITPALTPAEKSTAKSRIKKAINASGEPQDWKDQELARLEGKELVAETGSKESPIIAWLKKTFGKKADEPLTGSGFKALPNNKWVAYHTNSFEDKSHEIFTEAAHDQYIEWLDKGAIPYPDLWYWHIPGTKHGQAEWVDRVGHIVVSAGSFDDSELANLFRKEYEKNPQMTSHTYGYPKGGRLQDGSFQTYFTVEISPLPVGKQSSVWSPFMEVKEMPITPEKITKLEGILGKDLASEVLGNADKMSKELEAIGIKFKEAESIPAVDTDAREAIKELATANKAASDDLTAKLTELLTGIKAIQDGEKARNEAVAKLETFVKEQFELAPRATQSKQTVVDPKDPQVVALAAKAADPTATKPDPNATPGENLAALFLNFKAQS